MQEPVNNLMQNDIKYGSIPISPTGRTNKRLTKRKKKQRQVKKSVSQR